MNKLDVKWMVDPGGDGSLMQVDHPEDRPLYFYPNSVSQSLYMQDGPWGVIRTRESWTREVSRRVAERQEARLVSASTTTNSFWDPYPDGVG